MLLGYLGISSRSIISSEVDILPILTSEEQMEQLLYLKLTPEYLRQSKHVQCSIGEMFESALIVEICGPPWKRLLQNFRAFIDQFKRRPYDLF